MTHVAQLGGRAAFLLGMLRSPMTTVELYDLVAQAKGLGNFDEVEALATEVAGFRGGSIRITIDGILTGGTMEVLHQLERLEDAGCVARLGERDYDGCLWWALPASDWRTSG